MRRTKWTRALRPIPILAVLGAALGGCGSDVGPARYGGGYYGGGPGYYGSPYYGGGGYGDGGSPRRENWSQDRLRQHWIDQARGAR